MPTIKQPVKLSVEELNKKTQDLGKEDFEMKMSSSAKKVLTNFPNFPWAKFKIWYKKNYCVVGSSHILQYMEHQIEKDL